MKVAGVYENSNLFDKYTIIFNSGDALALSDHPNADNGWARWILVDEYDENNLGKQIEFNSLPDDVQDYVLTTINKN